MTQYKTEAIVLLSRDSGDADKLVTLFSRDFGKINTMAYGARRPRNRLSGYLQVFMNIDVALVAGKGIDSIKQCEPLQSFRQLRDTLTPMSYGFFLAELVSELCPERQPEPEVFDLLLQIFPLLLERNPRLVALAGAWKILSLLGYHPECVTCVSCGRPVCLPAHFSAAAGGAICTECYQPGLEEFSVATGEFLQVLLELNWSQPGHFKVSGAVLLQAERILVEYLGYRLDKKLKSLSFIQQLSVSNVGL